MLHILTNSYAVIDPLFGRPAGTFVEMDVGCGRGGFTLALAQRYPERLVLGTDVMLGRLRKIDAKAGKRGLQNLELLRASHTEMLGHQLPDSCIDRLHYLCPDPWPKSRHRAKRVASTDFFVRIARVVKPGGILHIATDHPPYLDLIHACLGHLPFFAAVPEQIADIADLQTDFEKQWLAEGKTVPHFAYRIVKEG
jgi:tRNA (guanine-N7-)-methyltransferase